MIEGSRRTQSPSTARIVRKPVRPAPQRRFQVIETHATALSEDALIERVCDAHYLGIRSRTRVTARVLEPATELRSVGCFCIGTNQVDTDGAKTRGVPVFNAPFSNTRSVAR